METLRELIEQAAEEYHDLPAVQWKKRKEVESRTYGELWDDARKLADGARSYFEGSLKGSHAALLGESSYPWITTYLGLTGHGAVVVPLDMMMPDEDLTDLIIRSDSEVLFVSPVRKTLIEKLSESIKNQTAGALRGIVLLSGEEDALPTWKTLVSVGEISDETEELLPAPEDLATIIFTSGTTGKAKGVMLTHRNQAQNVENVYIDVPAGRTMLSVLPIHHAYCLTMDWLKGFSKGAVVCINDSLMHLMKNMKLFRPHIMLMVPLMIETISKQLRQSGAGQLPPQAVYENVFGGRLHYIFSGGAHLDPMYIEEFSKYGIEVCEGYGMSECAPVISTGGQLGSKPGASGKLLPNVEARFVEGELQIRGSSVMKGYYKMPEETAEALEDGWLHTGDLASIDDEGYLHITGRIKNLIILSNGENVSPEHMEEELLREPFIDEAVVTGETNGLTAHFFTAPETLQALGMDQELVKKNIHETVNRFNQAQPSYKRITKCCLREEPFIKNTTKKIIRAKVDEADEKIF